MRTSAISNPDKAYSGDKVYLFWNNIILAGTGETYEGCNTVNHSGQPINLENEQRIKRTGIRGSFQGPLEVIVQPNIEHDKRTFASDPFPYDLFLIDKKGRKRDPSNYKSPTEFVVL